MNNIDLERAKKLIKTKKDEGDFQSLNLLMEAQQTKDFSKWQKFGEPHQESGVYFIIVFCFHGNSSSNKLHSFP